MQNIEHPINVINGCFQKFGKELEGLSPGCTERWNHISSISASNYFDLTGSGVYIHNVDINPENVGLITGAIDDFDDLVKNDPDHILGKSKDNISLMWSSVKRVLQEFAVRYMDEEQAYMYSTRKM